MPRLNILLLEDVPVDAELALWELERAGLRFRSVRVDDRRSYVRELREFSPDVILADFALPGFSGLDALKAKNDICPDVPFIFVSGVMGEERAIGSLKKGAADYILKGNLSRLPAAIDAAVAGASETKRRKRSEEALWKANRSLRTITACHQALVRARNEAELLDSVCGRLVETGGYRMAWIGFIAVGDTRRLEPRAWAGYEQGFLAALSAGKAWGPEKGIAWKAAATGEVVFERDISQSPCHQWRDEAQRRRYRSAIALPVSPGGEARGVLCLFTGAPDDFEAEEVAMLSELARDLSFGVMSLRSRAGETRAKKEMEKMLAKLRAISGATVQALALAVEKRDPYTAGHQRRVADLARSIALKMDVGQDVIDGIRMAGLIHDLGKIYIPSEILSKPGTLAEVDRAFIEMHPAAGYDILKEIDFPWPVAEIVFQHHERVDGSGYPQGLKADEILPEGRILAVADVVEAMSSHRPYRPALGVEYALETIEKDCATLFEPDVVRACMAVFQEDGYRYS